MKIQKSLLADLFIDVIIAWGFTQFFDQWLTQAGINFIDSIFVLFFFALWWLWYLYLWGDCLFKTSYISNHSTDNIQKTLGVFFIIFGLLILILINSISSIFIGHASDFMFLFGLLRLLLVFFYVDRFLKQAKYHHSSALQVHLRKTKSSVSKPTTKILGYIFLILSFFMACAYIGMSFTFVSWQYLGFFGILLVDILLLWIWPLYKSFDVLSAKNFMTSRYLPQVYERFLHRLLIFTVIFISLLGNKVFNILFTSSMSWNIIMISAFFYVNLVAIMLMYYYLIGTFFNKRQTGITAYYKTLGYSYLHSLFYLVVMILMINIFRVLLDPFTDVQVMLTSGSVIIALLWIFIFQMFHKFVLKDISILIISVLGILLSTGWFLYNQDPEQILYYLLSLSFWVLLLPLLQGFNLIKK